jgi:DNA-directed RNA polymerase sigma subunit (sigma70/sigma32)
MKNSCRAEDIFRDFPSNLKSKIFAATEGKLVYFHKKNNNQQKIDREKALVTYVSSKRSYSELGEELGVSKVRICQIVNQERRKFSRERVEYWENRGLSLREIGRLYKKSHERVRQIADFIRT